MLNSIGEFLSIGVNLLLFMVILPAACGVLLWLFRKQYILQLAAALLSASLNLVFAFGIYTYGEFFTRIPFAAFGFEYLLRVYEFSALFIAFTAVVFLLIVLYTVVHLKNIGYNGLYLLYLYISMAMINGALLSDNLGMMLLFWEGLLCTLFGMLLIGNKENPRTAVKALTISGLAVLLLMLGIILTAYMAGTANISEMGKLSLNNGICLLGFISIMLGALGKSGCMPFHSWIPDAADDAPIVFMAALPGALEKILGIYFTARIVLDIYNLEPGGSMSIAIMLLGAVTIVFAGAMALIQKDMKRLLSYSAISQLGYMVLGIGTGLPVGILGGLFHLMNYVIFITGLLMISGSIEKQTGTTDLNRLGGLYKKMPVTMVCFIICALSITGFPGFNGFFSMELVSDAALESNIIFYICALLGAFLTALSFLKMGRAVFFGEQKLQSDIKEVHETKAGMLIPISILSAFCVLLGLFNTLPLDGLLSPVLGIKESFSRWPHSAILAVFSVIVLLIAVCDHIYGFKRTGNALSATEHIYYAPGLKSIYQLAEKGCFDPYNWMMAVTGGFSDICVWIEHGVSWIYDTAVPGLVKKAGSVLHQLDDGSLSRYLFLAVLGVAFIMSIFAAVLI